MSSTRFDEQSVSDLLICVEESDYPLVDLIPSPEWVTALDAVDLRTALASESYLKWDGPLAKFFDVATELGSVYLPLKSREAEPLEGLLAIELLRLSGFDRHAFNYLKKPQLQACCRGNSFSVVPDLVLQQRGGPFRLCIVDERKSSTYSEPRVVAATVAVALYNCRMRGGEQTVHAVRIIGTTLRFYKAVYDEEYLRSLELRYRPMGYKVFTRYPATGMGVDGGLNLLDSKQRHVALRYLASLCAELKSPPPQDQPEEPPPWAVVADALAVTGLTSTST